MKYLYESKKGKQIVVEMGMNDEHPEEIVREKVKYHRVFTVPRFHIPVRDRLDNKKDLDDYQSQKISHGHVKVKSKSGKSYVPAQLVQERSGEHKLVYKSCPTRDTGVKPTREIIETLGKNMEKFV